MVKNLGGNKAKGQARKFVTGQKSNHLRFSEHECEVYAQVTKILGNGMCHAICMDNIVRLCHIRGKFRGRGKRDNIVTNGTWILIGLREWELDKKMDDKKLQNCDLLEVYSSVDKERLKNTLSHLNWTIFITNDNMHNNITEDDNTVKFMDESTEDYQKIIEAQFAITEKQNISNIINIVVNSEEISVDDI